MCHERRAYMACVRLLFLSIESLDELRLCETYSTLARRRVLLFYSCSSRRFFPTHA